MSEEMASAWRSLRSQHRLHPAVQSRLKDLFHQLGYDGFALAEGYGLAVGHRSDLVLYLQNRRAVHFELFASKSMVDRDAKMLLMSRADVRVAIILDASVDPSVAKAYFLSVGDNRFDWVWASLFLDERRTDEALGQLRAFLADAESIGGPLVATGSQIAVSPPSGPPFTQVSISVAGFHPRQDVDVYWDPQGLTAHLARVRDLDDAGEGQCEGFIPHGLIAPVGHHVIRAIDTLGNSATANFEVTVAVANAFRQDRAEPGKAG